MAKKKVVLKLSNVGDAKNRSKAMQCAVGLNGIESVSMDGDKITVVGEGIDSVQLTKLLRKKMGYADLMTVASVEEKKETKAEPPAPAKTAQQLTWPSYYGGPVVAQPPYYYDVREPSYDEDSCCIM
ncbi:hypothetical protein KSP39_PZI023937 [Platanthera zijinensis]|uniref:Uncharacterized protein n=1 Tax=Platanthera zijinensis TaxID=2320716 RepID=A0AAP0ATN9_9ASPA